MSYPTAEGEIARFITNTFECTYGTFSTGTVDDGGVFQKTITHGMSKVPDLIMVHQYLSNINPNNYEDGYNGFMKEYPNPMMFAWGIKDSFQATYKGGLGQLGVGFPVSIGIDRQTASNRNIGCIGCLDETTFTVGKKQSTDTEGATANRFLPNSSYYWFAFRGLTSEE